MLPRWASRCFYGHPERVGGERGGRVVADRPADHASAVGVENDRAVHLALADRVLGNVGQPQLIRAFPTESAVDQIVRARLARHPSSFRRSRATRDARAAHQHRDRVVTNPDPAPEDQLCVYPSGAVVAVGGRVHLADHIGQPRMANRARRWRPASPHVVASARHPEHPTRNLNRQALSGDHMRSLRTAFWAHRLLQQLRSPAVHRDLRLELPNPPFRSAQLLTLHGAQTRAARPDRFSPGGATNKSTGR